MAIDTTQVASPYPIGELKYGLRLGQLAHKESGLDSTLVDYSWMAYRCVIYANTRWSR